MQHRASCGFPPNVVSHVVRYQECVAETNGFEVQCALLPCVNLWRWIGHGKNEGSLERNGLAVHQRLKFLNFRHRTLARAGHWLEMLRTTCVNGPLEIAARPWRQPLGPAPKTNSQNKKGLLEICNLLAKTSTEVLRNSWVLKHPGHCGCRVLVSCWHPARHSDV